MLPANYKCEGQLSLWDIFKEEPEGIPDDSICEGCKWRNAKGRHIELHDTGDTWVYACPGRACANWPRGTAGNLSFENKRLYCYNRDFLPPLDVVADLIEKEFDIKLKETIYNRKTEYVYKRKKSTLTIDESNYVSYDEKENGKRFIGVDWDRQTEGFSRPCDSLHTVFRAVEMAIERTESGPTKENRTANVHGNQQAN